MITKLSTRFLQIITTEVCDDNVSYFIYWTLGFLTLEEFETELFVEFDEFVEVWEEPQNLDFLDDVVFLEGVVINLRGFVLRIFKSDRSL